ncbi:MAG: type I restriction enzyme HsdR N-terminal domain-containing protein [Methylobacter sp.]|jgi:hypothetical protein
MAKSEAEMAEVALELFQSVEQSSKKQRHFKSSTFWHLFGVHRRNDTITSSIIQLLEAQDLKVWVKSGKPLGDEDFVKDWVVVTLRLRPDDLTLDIDKRPPCDEWFKTMISRSFESEREIECFFICPLLEELGYGFDDIAIGYPVEMFKGAKKTTTEADFAVFKGLDRDEKSSLLVIEAKKAPNGINQDHIKQARSYAQELLPAYYVVTNGREIKVYNFNGMLAPDECVMDFDRTTLKEKWQELYSHIGKEATLNRKEWLSSKLGVLMKGNLVQFF